MPRITISYRRDDSLDITGRIFDRLAAHFGRESVFRDIDNIPLGVDFRRHIDGVLGESDIILAVVGPRWIGPRANQSRLVNPADPVRLEIETALEKQKPLIPVLVSRATMPRADQLPDSLRDFAFRNGLQVDAGQDFDQHIARLLRGMEAILGTEAQQIAAGDTPDAATTDDTQLDPDVRAEKEVQLTAEFAALSDANRGLEMQTAALIEARDDQKRRAAVLQDELDKARQETEREVSELSSELAAARNAAAAGTKKTEHLEAQLSTRQTEIENLSRQLAGDRSTQPRPSPVYRAALPILAIALVAAVLGLGEVWREAGSAVEKEGQIADLNKQLGSAVARNKELEAQLGARSVAQPAPIAPQPSSPSTLPPTTAPAVSVGLARITLRDPKIDEIKGAVITSITGISDFQIGDIVTQIDDKAVYDIAVLHEVVRNLKPGSMVEVTIWRGKSWQYKKLALPLFQ
jgi:hypothetical protein